MTATVSAPPTKGGKAQKQKQKVRGPAVIGLPQVNLLPPEVRAARGLKVVKRWLVVSLVVLLVVLAGVFVWAVMDRATAQEELARAQEETARLQAEEREYAEVPLVLRALEDTTTARELGMSTEVTWKPYLDAITAVLPADVSIESLALMSGTPMTAAPAPSGPLEEPSLARLTFAGRTGTLPDAAALMDALDSIPGFADAWVSSAAVEGAEGVTYYVINATVQVTDAARAERFAAEAVEGE